MGMFDLLRSCWHPWIKKSEASPCSSLQERLLAREVRIFSEIPGGFLLMFKKRNSGRWQRKVGLHLSDRFSWVLRLVDNLPWFYTNWHWVHNRNSGVLGEYLCSAPVLLWIRSTLWTSTWGQGRGFRQYLCIQSYHHPHPSIHPSFPATFAGPATHRRWQLPGFASFRCSSVSWTKQKVYEKWWKVSVWCPLDSIEIIWNQWYLSAKRTLRNFLFKPRSCLYLFGLIFRIAHKAWEWIRSRDESATL